MLASTLLLSACGQRGPLYLPTPPAEPPPRPGAQAPGTPGVLAPETPRDTRSPARRPD